MTEDAAVIEDLGLLRREWGHAYAISFQAGQYCACPRLHNAAICRLATDDLRREMDADYRACPVRR